jgi:PKD repeat protein
MIDLDLPSSDDTEPDGVVKLLTAIQTLQAATNDIITALTATSATNLNPRPVITVTDQSNLAVALSAATSVDPDGIIVAYDWKFGDGTIGSGVYASHTYTAPGTYTVTLTVTDDDGATASTTKNVTASSPASTTVVQQTGPGITTYQTAAGSDFNTKLNGIGSNKLSLQVGTRYQLPGFSNYTYTNANGSGGFGAVTSTSGGMLGAGPKSSIVELVPNSMTQAVPTASGTTNGFYVLGFSHVNNARVDNFQINGTTQPRVHNGMMLQYCDTPNVSRILVKNIFGDFTSPPGETFYINQYKGVGGTFDTIECDGSNGTQTPSGWLAAAMLGTNTTTGKITIRRLYGHESRWSKSYAGWQGTGGGQFSEIWTVNTYYGVGFEEMSGTYYLDDCVWGGNGVDIHLGHSSVYNGGVGAKLIIRNPHFLGSQTKLRVFIPPAYSGGQKGSTGNVQTKSDITILTGSQSAGWTDVTSSVLLVQTAYLPNGGYGSTPIFNYTKPSWALQ